MKCVDLDEFTGPCAKGLREDGKSVVFIEVEEADKQEGHKMKQTIEEAAQDCRITTAETMSVHGQYHSIDDCPNHGISCDELVESSFIKGAEWQSKQSPWISVKDELPKDYFKQKMILLKDGQIRIAILDYYDENDYKTVYFWYDREADASFDLEDVIAWMEIPSFDEILGTDKQE